MKQRIVTTTKAAEILGISVGTAQLWFEQGKIPSWKTPGGHRRAKREDVEKLLPDRGAGPGITKKVVGLISSRFTLKEFEDVATACKPRDFRLIQYTDAIDAAFRLHRDPVECLFVEICGEPSNLRLVDRISREFRKKITIVFLVSKESKIISCLKIPPHLNECEAIDNTAACVFEFLRNHRTYRDWISPIDSEIVGRQPYPVPPNETARARAVDQLAELGNAPDAVFSALIAVVTRIFSVKIAVIGFMSRDMLSFKVRKGVNIAQLRRDQTICTYTILSEEGLWIEDASRDPRFKNLDGVAGPPFARFYAGAPLYDANGLALGTLCVADPFPRAYAPADMALLRELASVVSSVIQLKAQKLNTRSAKRRLMRSRSS